jgi:hypothetical protein
VIYISTSAGVSSVYLSTNSTATSGKSSGTSFEYGTVYGFVKMSSSNYNAYNIPKSWTYVTYSGGYYHYLVGSTQADGSSYRTISYTAATAKPKLSAPSASVKTSGSNYIAELHNNANVAVTVNVTWYNASTNASLGSTTVSPGTNGTSTTTLAISKADSVYVKAYATASGYLQSDTTTSSTCAGKLLAPTLVSVDAIADDYSVEYRTNLEYSYNRYVTAVIKNPNNRSLTCIVISNDVSSAMVRGNSNTVAAGATSTITFSANAGGSISVHFADTGITSSNLTISCPSISGGDGGQT